MATFVLVHGGWDGGWAWRAVARALGAAGHDVFTPTLTGSGERVHLARRDVGLPTHILDVVNVLRYEDLHEVVLVGSSYGGMAVTGVAEQVPERLRLIYLDGFVPQDGESLADLIGPELTALFTHQAQNVGDGWRVPHLPPDADRRTDLLLKVVTHPLSVQNADAARVLHTYVLHTAKSVNDPLAGIFARLAERARAAGWRYRELATEHWPLLDQPKEVAALLQELADQIGANSAT